MSNKQDLLALALQTTKGNISSSKGGTRTNTYLDKFVDVLTDDNDQPTDPKTRLAIITEISLDICIEKRNAAIEDGEDLEPFGLETDEDKEIFKKVNKKVKNQVSAAIANNKNATSLSFNVKYKDIWAIKKHDGGLVSLIAKEEEIIEEEEEVVENENTVEDEDGNYKTQEDVEEQEEE